MYQLELPWLVSILASLMPTSLYLRLCCMHLWLVIENLWSIGSHLLTLKKLHVKRIQKLTTQHGTYLMYELWKLYLRSMMEADMRAVSMGTKTKSQVLEACLQQMKACFLDVLSLIFPRDNIFGCIAMCKYMVLCCNGFSIFFDTMCVDYAMLMLYDY